MTLGRSTGRPSAAQDGLFDSQPCPDERADLPADGTGQPEEPVPLERREPAGSGGSNYPEIGDQDSDNEGEGDYLGFIIITANIATMRKRWLQMITWECDVMALQEARHT